MLALECDRRSARPADCGTTEQDPELALRRYFKPDKCQTAKGSPYGKNQKNEPRDKNMLNTVNGRAKDAPNNQAAAAKANGLIKPT